MGRRIAWAAVGATAMYLFDPDMGRTRRARLADQIAARFRGGVREVGRKAEYVGGHFEGVKHAVRDGVKLSPNEKDALRA